MRFLWNLFPFDKWRQGSLLCQPGTVTSSWKCLLSLMAGRIRSPKQRSALASPHFSSPVLSSAASPHGRVSDCHARIPAIQPAPKLPGLLPCHIYHQMYQECRGHLNTLKTLVSSFFFFMYMEPETHEGKAGWRIPVSISILSFCFTVASTGWGHFLLKCLSQEEELYISSQCLQRGEPSERKTCRFTMERRQLQLDVYSSH